MTSVRSQAVDGIDWAGGKAPILKGKRPLFPPGSHSGVKVAETRSVFGFRPAILPGSPTQAFKPESHQGNLRVGFRRNTNPGSYCRSLPPLGALNELAFAQAPTNSQTLVELRRWGWVIPGRLEPTGVSHTYEVGRSSQGGRRVDCRVQASKDPHRHRRPTTKRCGRGTSGMVRDMRNRLGRECQGVLFPVRLLRSSLSVQPRIGGYG